MTYASREEIGAMKGRSVYASDGSKIGSVEDFYLDPGGKPEWIGLGTGFLGTKHILVPASKFQPQDDGYYVPYEKDFVKNSPDFDGDEIDEASEMELRSYWQVGPVEHTRPAGMSEGGNEQTMTGQARLRKWRDE